MGHILILLSLVLVYQNCSGINFSAGQNGGNSAASVAPGPFVLLPKAQFTEVSAGSQTTCAVTSDQKVRCWGANSAGQLGNGSTTDSRIAVEVAGLTSVKHVENKMATYACALLVDGSVKCWGTLVGYNGSDPRYKSLLPVATAGLSGPVQKLSMTVSHICALIADGTVQCWGQNDLGEVGNGTTTTIPVLVPERVTGLAGVKDIATSNDHSCALMSDGTVQCWGSNQIYQLARDYGSPNRSAVPLAIPGVSGVIAIAAGGDATCALLTDASLRCWGGNFYGQQGNGTRYSGVQVPARPPGLPAIKSLSAGTGSLCAVTAANEVYCAGSSVGSPIANGDQVAMTFVKVPSLSSVVAVSAGFVHNCGLISDQSVWCWGTNSWGQFGNNSLDDSVTPTPQFN